VDDAPDLPARWARLALGAAALTLTASAVPGFFLGDGAPYGNDNSSHFAEILAVADHLRAGETDFWFDQTNLGYPLFVAYQPLPALLMGALVALLGGAVAPLLLFKLSIVLLWALMPVAWYAGARALGMDRLGALFLGLLLLVVNDFRAFGLGLSSGLANGLYTQAWGALLLPLALGHAWRFVVRGEGGPGRPALLFAATALSHAFLGLYAGLAAAAMVVVRRAGAAARARRLAAVVALAAPLLAFWLVPFLANLEHQGGLPWKSESENGYALATLARRAASGALFDHGRLPWLTYLALAGAVAAWRRRADVDRWLLVLLAATAALLLGPTTWGPWYRALPLHGELEVIRYLAGLHVCGLALAALAARRAVPRLRAFLARASGPAWLSPDRTLAAIGVVVLAGFLLGTWGHGRRYLRSFDVGERGFAALRERLAADTRSRFLVHGRLGTANHFFLNLLPALAGRPQLESYARGYHDTPSVYYLEYFDWSPSAFSLYNVGAAVARGGRGERLPDGFRETWSHGELRLLEPPEPPGWFAFVRTPFTVVGDARAVRRLLRVSAVRLYEKGVLPRLAERDPGTGDRIVVGPDGRVTRVALAALADGEPTGESVARALASYAPGPPRSRVLEASRGRNEYRALVEAAGGEDLLLKASHHPYWGVRVDGAPAELLRVAPHLMAVSVPPGRHEVVFRYRNPTYQKALFAVSAAAFAGGPLAGLARRRRAGVTERAGR